MEKDVSRKVALCAKMSKQTQQVKKGPVRGAKAKALSGMAVQTFCNPRNIVVPNPSEVEPPGRTACG